MTMTLFINIKKEYEDTKIYSPTFNPNSANKNIRRKNKYQKHLSINYIWWGRFLNFVVDLSPSSSALPAFI